MRTVRLDQVAACIKHAGIKSVAVTGVDDGTVASVAAWLSSRNAGLEVDERYGAVSVSLVVECPRALDASETLSQLPVLTRLPPR